jgi:release factor glutamine methyltransferase
LFGGTEGMALITAITQLASRWLVDGGLLAVEHDDTASAAVVTLLRHTGGFDDVTPHADFAGRSRFVTARRKIAP